MIQRADRLYAEGRWAEAAAAYRELLRADPRNSDADRWKRRAVAASRADYEVTSRRLPSAPKAAQKSAAEPRDKASLSAPAADEAQH
jgi:hypothetical protein